MNYLQIISSLASLGACFISLLVFKRQKTFENENHLFKYKIDKYHAIIDGVADFLSTLYNDLLTIQDELNRKHDQDDDILDSSCENIEAQFDLLRLILDKNTAFIDTQIVDQIDKLFNELFDDQEKALTELLDLNLIKAFINKLDSYEESANSIINSMRKDLGILTLEGRLRKRTR